MAGNYDLDLFINLSKYKPTETVTPLENFTTELFVYVLKDLLKQNNKTGYEILRLFGIQKKERILDISTQNEYKVDKRILKPDIEIDLADRVVFIEVKVDSTLRSSILKRGLSDQLEDYQQIQVSTGKPTVYSLTKHKVNSPVKTNIRWYQITKKLKSLEGNNQIIDNFISFLEEYNMGETKPITSDSKNLLSTYHSFFQYLIDIFEASEFNNNDKYKYGSKFIDEHQFYLNIMENYQSRSANEEHSYYYYGLYDIFPNKIVFQVLNGTLLSKFQDPKTWKNKGWKEDSIILHPIISTIDISDITKKRNYETQVEIGAQWLNSIYKNLKKIVNPDYI